MDKPLSGYAQWKRIGKIVAGSVGEIASVALAFATSSIELATLGVHVVAGFTEAVRRGETWGWVRGSVTLAHETEFVITTSSAGRIEGCLSQPRLSLVPGTGQLGLSIPFVLREWLDAEAQLKEVRASLKNVCAQMAYETATADEEGQFLQAKAQCGADLASTKEALADQLTLMEFRVSIESCASPTISSAPGRTPQDARWRDSSERREPAPSRWKRSLPAAGAGRSAHDPGRIERNPPTLGCRGRALGRPEGSTADSAGPGTPQGRAEPSGDSSQRCGVRAAGATRFPMQRNRRRRFAYRSGGTQRTVLMDIRLQAEMRRGARPDLNVDATIELERLETVLLAGRPTHARGRK